MNNLELKNVIENLFKTPIKRKPLTKKQIFSLTLLKTLIEHNIEIEKISNRGEKMKDIINIKIEHISNGYLYTDDTIASLTTKQYFKTRDELVSHIVSSLKCIGII